VSEQIEATTAVAGDDTPLADLESGDAPVELPLGDVPSILQTRRVDQALAEHEQDERIRRTPR